MKALTSDVNLLPTDSEMINFETNCWLIWFWRHHGFWEHGWQWEGHLLKPLLCCEEAACPIISKESIKISFRLTLPSPRLKSIVVWKKKQQNPLDQGHAEPRCNFLPKIYFPEVPACQCEGCRVVEEQSSSVFLPHQPSGSESCWGLCCEIYFHKKRVWIIHQQMDWPQSNLICSFLHLHFQQ